MKICLTGHKNGLGEALYHQLKLIYNNVIGFDFPDDLNNQEVEDRFFTQLSDSDVVILNAPAQQLRYLKRICQQYYSDSKKVIVIGSVISSLSEKSLYGLSDIIEVHIKTHKKAWNQYQEDKKNLKQFVSEWQFKNYVFQTSTKLQVSMLNLQQLDDPRSELDFNRMPFQKVIDLIHDIIDNDHILNSEVWHV